jgi:hypothetical protein
MVKIPFLPKTKTILDDVVYKLCDQYYFRNERDNIFFLFVFC